MASRFSAIRPVASATLRRAAPFQAPLVASVAATSLKQLRTYSVLRSSLPSYVLPSKFRQHNVFLLQSRSYSESEKIVNVPSLADSITEGELAKWQVAVGEFVKQDNVVAVIETDKVNIDINAPQSGVLLEQYAKEGESVSVGQKLFKLKLGAAPDAASTPSQKAEESKSAASPKPETPKVEATPKPEQNKPEPPKPTEAVTQPNQSPAQVRGNGLNRVKMTRLRQRVAERLKESQDTAASLTTFNEVDLKNLVDLRNEYKDAFVKKHGIKLGFMSAFLKASAVALQEIPEINASVEGQDIIYHDFVDISVAVATPKGLVTPVVRGVETMSYLDIERTLNQLSIKARDSKITVEDLAGGTFTVSNGGVFGSLMGTPIINLPQSAILGMHAVKDRPVAVNGQVVIRPMMYVALTYDHRIIDGREAVSFLVRVKELVEDPRRLLLEL